MGWQDRDYNQGSERAREFFGNPALILSMAVPFGTWFGSSVRLHFWLLLSFLFVFVDGMRMHASLADPAFYCVLLTAILLMHEFGHRIAATWVGGRHYEFVLWPAGGMVPVQTPQEPWATFVGNFGGMASNLILCGLMEAISVGWLHTWQMPTILPFSPLMVHVGSGFWATLVPQVFTISWSIFLINCLPYYWFDGTNLMQAILWPLTGLYQAINVTCIVGMVLAVPLFLLAVYATDFLGMVICVLLFASAYQRRQALKAAGVEGLQEQAIGFSASSYEHPTKAKRKRWWSMGKKSGKRALAEYRQQRAEQAKIDAILAKVHDKGLHSLTWFEKRTLKKATERQRQRDLAGRQ